MASVTGTLFFIIGALLFANVFWLINRLKTRRDIVSTKDGSASFNKEIRILWIILGIFSGSYIIRGFWDLFIWYRLDDRLGYAL